MDTIITPASMEAEFMAVAGPLSREKNFCILWLPAVRGLSFQGIVKQKSLQSFRFLVFLETCDTMDV